MKDLHCATSAQLATSNCAGDCSAGRRSRFDQTDEQRGSVAVCLLQRCVVLLGVRSSAAAQRRSLCACRSAAAASPPPLTQLTLCTTQRTHAPVPLPAPPVSARMSAAAASA